MDFAKCSPNLYFTEILELVFTTKAQWNTVLSFLLELEQDWNLEGCENFDSDLRIASAGPIEFLAYEQVWNLKIRFRS